LTRRTLAPAGSYSQIGKCRKSRENASFQAWAQGVAGSNPVAPTNVYRACLRGWRGQAPLMGILWALAVGADPSVRPLRAYGPTGGRGHTHPAPVGTPVAL